MNADREQRIAQFEDDYHEGTRREMLLHLRFGMRKDVSQSVVLVF